MTRDELKNYKDADFRNALLDNVVVGKYLVAKGDEENIPSNIDELCIAIYLMNKRAEDLRGKDNRINTDGSNLYLPYGMLFVGELVVLRPFIHSAFADDSVNMFAIAQYGENNVPYFEVNMLDRVNHTIHFYDMFENSAWNVEDLGNGQYKVTREE